MDRLESMEVFVKAIDLGSFTATAAALDLSGPMVGKHVRFLEERLGVRLINRTTRRQSLTDFGRAYYERCRIVLAEAQAADALAADQLSEPRGKLRVTMPAHLGRHCVTPILLALARRHPTLELDLSLSDRFADLVEDGFDMAIRTGALDDRAGIIGRRVARQRMLVCASPSYIETFGKAHRSGGPRHPSGNRLPAARPCVAAMALPARRRFRRRVRAGRSIASRRSRCDRRRGERRHGAGLAAILAGA
ncbi:hypothetical protein MPLA_1390150 [Mesorhizobium sp. ORS 3359]|nr:hypothetical protein MPLA_1390150 [Mesorhizobium sp. ORS 3359]